MGRKQEKAFDPFFIGDVNDSASRPPNDPSGDIPQRASASFDKRMLWGGVNTLVLRILDVMEDYYTILSECCGENISLQDKRVSAVDVLSEVVRRPATPEEWALRNYVSTGKLREEKDSVEYGFTQEGEVSRRACKYQSRLFSALALLRCFQARAVQKRARKEDSERIYERLKKQEDWLLQDAEFAVAHGEKLRHLLESGEKLSHLTPERRSEINVANARNRLAGYREDIIELIRKAISKHPDTRMTSVAIVRAIQREAKAAAVKHKVRHGRNAGDCLLKRVQRWRPDKEAAPGGVKRKQ